MCAYSWYLLSNLCENENEGMVMIFPIFDLVGAIFSKSFGGRTKYDLVVLGPVYHLIHVLKHFILVDVNYLYDIICNKPP